MRESKKNEKPRQKGTNEMKKEQILIQNILMRMQIPCVIVL